MNRVKMMFLKIQFTLQKYKFLTKFEILVVFLYKFLDFNENILKLQEITENPSRKLQLLESCNFV